jgi:hypothetical protein
MLVTFYSSGTGTPISENLSCSVKWSAPFSREIGSATIEVPKFSDMYASTHIDKKGGFIVSIIDTRVADTVRKAWVGVADIPSINANGMTINCYEITYLLNTRFVKSNRTFTAVPAGEIFRSALLETFLGVQNAAFTLGSVAESAPFVPQYQFSGQSLLQVMNDLYSITAQEYFFSDNEDSSGTFKINWGTQNWVPDDNDFEPLVDGGNFLNVTREGDISSFATEVTAIGKDGSSYTAYGPARNMLSPEHVIKVDTKSPTELKMFADAELVRYGEVPYIYSGQVPNSFLIRLGNHYNIISTRFNDGDIIMARVSSIELSDNTNYQKVTLRYPSVKPQYDFSRLFQKNIVIRDTAQPSEQSCFGETKNKRLSKFTSVTSTNSIDQAGGNTTRANLTFERVVDQCHAGYSIRYRKASLPSYQYLPVIRVTSETVSSEEVSAATTMTAIIENLVAGEDYHIGIATLAKNGLYSDYSGDTAPMEITTASTANPMVLTKTSHGLVTGDTVRVTGWGISNLKGREFKITRLSSSTFSIAVNGAIYGGASATASSAAWVVKSNILISAAGDTTAPAQVTGLSATAGIKTIVLAWGAVADKDLSHYEIEASPTGSGSWSSIGTARATRFIETFTGTSNTARYYRVRAIDTSGNQGTYSSNANTTPLSISTGVASNDITTTMINNSAVTSAKIDTAAVTPAKLGQAAEVGTLGHSSGGQIVIGSGGLTLNRNGAMKIDIYNGSGLIEFGAQIQIASTMHQAHGGGSGTPGTCSNVMKIIDSGGSTRYIPLYTNSTLTS